MPVPGHQLRHAMSRWASGVTIVTARGGGKIHGMTVSAFASVSLEPPLVLVCADQSSHTHEVVAEAGAFAVHVLAVGQEELSTRFADKRLEDVRFEGLEWRPGVTGSPILEGGVAVLDCAVHAAHEAGDHVLYVGRVEAVELRDGEPLCYHRGGYRRLAPTPAPPTGPGTGPEAGPGAGGRSGA